LAVVLLIIQWSFKRFHFRYRHKGIHTSSAKQLSKITHGIKQKTRTRPFVFEYALSWRLYDLFSYWSTVLDVNIQLYQHYRVFFEVFLT